MARPPKLREEQLISFVEDLKRQWMSTIDALVDPLMIVKFDFTISKANLAMAKIGGAPIKAIIGKKCYNVFAGRSSPCPGCKLKEAAQSKTAKQFELDDIIKNRFFEVTSQPLADGSGEIDSVVQVYRDRTEAHELRRQLLQSEKLSSIGLLAGGVAHEINNPLGGILVFAQMLLREIAKDSPHYEDVKEILHAAERCKSIVENLLDFARTSKAGSKSSDVGMVGVSEAIKTALRFGRVAAPRKNVEIIEEWEDENVQIKADRNKLIQLFLNLIQNAIQAMPDGGTLTLRSFNDKKADQPSAVFQVIDTGVGIPDDHLGKIFDPFFTTKDPGEGTGLGLAICYGIVKELGGEIEVFSEENQGTTFSVRFPIAKNNLKESA